AEIAVKCCHRIDRLILVDALGIKISDRETPDILDVFNTLPQEVQQRSWHDPGKWAPDFNAMSDDELVVRARNWEAACLYGWHPYMYNPQLKRWLRRITTPTLVVWGASDGIVKPSYGRVYSALIPGARFELIERAGSSRDRAGRHLRRCGRPLPGSLTERADGCLVAVRGPVPVRFSGHPQRGGLRPREPGERVL